MNKLFTLGKNDVVKGAITAILAAVVTVLYGVVSQSEFSVFTADWGTILGNILNVSFSAFLAYMMKNFATNSNDEFLTSEE